MILCNYKPLYTLLICIGYTAIISAQEGNVSITQDHRITTLLEIKKTLNKNYDVEKRYRIQIYNGTLSGARDALKGFRSTFPDWSSDIRFETPNYKVWVGKYRTRLEADRYLVKIKEKYPSAFIPGPQ